MRRTAVAVSQRQLLVIEEESNRSPEEEAVTKEGGSAGGCCTVRREDAGHRTQAGRTATQRSRELERQRRCSAHRNP